MEGDDPKIMHQKMAATLEHCIQEIRSIQEHARSTHTAERPRWPMVILRSPKGWTGPKQLDGHNVEGFWLAHQVPILDVATNPAQLCLLEDWMRSYKPEELFDASGKLVPELKELAPQGNRRLSANPHANGGVLRKALRLPDFRDFSVPVTKPGTSEVVPTVILADFLAETMRRNMDSFRVFGPDEIASNWASNDQADELDVVMACAGDIATMESLAAVAILRERFPDLKIRFVNVVDLFKLEPDSEHPHGLSDRDFDSLFTQNKPIIFNFHGYPSLIYKLTYRRTNHENMHVRGYNEKGNINTPLELAILNQVDRYNLSIDVIDRVPKLRVVGAHTKEWLKDQITDAIRYAHENGIDREDIRNWKWPL